MKASSSKKPDETKTTKVVRGKSRVDGNGFLYRKLNNGTTTVQNKKTGRTLYYKDDKGVIFNNTGGSVASIIEDTFKTGKQSRWDIPGAKYQGAKDNTLAPNKIKPRRTPKLGGKAGSKSDIGAAIKNLKTAKPKSVPYKPQTPKANTPKKRNSPSTPYRPIYKGSKIV